MIHCIRILLSIGLIYFVWKETGVATAIAMLTIMIGSEATSYSIRNILTMLKIINNRKETT